MHRPELHFAHANGIPSACYRKLHEALGAHYDVHAVPMLGTDPRFPVEPSCTGLMEQVVDSIRTRCDGPVVGVGHSLGAITTFMAAHRHPELFTSLVLLDPPIIDGVGGFLLGMLKAVGKQDVMTPARRSKHRRETWPSRVAARESLQGKALFRAFDPSCFDDYIAHALVDDEDGVRLAIPVATEVAIFRVTPHSWAPFPPPLRVPASMLMGSQSELAKRNRPQRFARRYGMALDMIDGGHMFPLERPDETAEKVLATLRA